MDEMTLLKELEPDEPTGGELAAAVTAVVVILPGGGHGRVGAPPAAADPITVMRQAATAALATPDRAPRGDQFLYVQDGNYESWLSMDGAHDGAQAKNGTVVTEPGCRNGVQEIPGNPPRSVPCTPDPAYVADAPTSTPSMVAYLKRHYGAAGANGMGKGIMFLLADHYLRPAARAALFNAATEVAGLHLVAAPVGSSAVGIGWQVCPAGDCGGAMLLFDRTTHVYLGVQTTGVNGERSAGGTPKQAVVDHVGDRP